MYIEPNNCFLPVSIRITGKKIVIIGGGNVALHKALLLSRFTKEATVVSPQFREGFQELPFTLVRKRYQSTDLLGAFLVYVCTENELLNRQIKADATTLGVLASVCDNPPLCDFTSPAIYQAGEISIAVSSNASDVRRSIRIRDRIQEWMEREQQFLT